MTIADKVTALVSALSNLDADAFAALLADEVVVEHVPIGRTIEGKDNVVGWFASMVGMTEANEVELRRHCVDGSTVWAERVDRHRIGGQWHDIPVMGIIQFDDAGGITLMRDYFDSRLAL